MIQSFLLFKFHKIPTLCACGLEHFVEVLLDIFCNCVCPPERTTLTENAHTECWMFSWQTFPGSLTCDNLQLYFFRLEDDGHAIQNCCCCCCCCRRARVIWDRLMTNYDLKKQKTKMKTNVGVLTVRMSANKCVSV